MLTTLTLAVLLVGGLVLHDSYPRDVRSLLRASPLSWAEWLFIALSFVHILLILGTRTVFTTALSLEAQRQTLPGLLLTPLRRAEMLWAMAVPPAAAALLAAGAGLPVYLLLREFGGCEWSDLGWLYVVFALLAFDPPTYLRPALSPDPPPLVTARSGRSRRAGGNALSSVPLLMFLTWTLGNWIRGMGGWGFHLLSVLPSPVQNLLLVFFAWPYCAALILAAPLPFFGGHLPVFLYVVPLLAVGWVTSSLRTGAALSAGDTPEMRRLPLSRRANALYRWNTRLGLFCFLAVVWQPWVLGGDTGRLLGVAAPRLAENLAGLLLVLGAFALVRVVSSAASAAPVRKDTGMPRPLRPLLRRVLRRTARPLRLSLLLFALACLCGDVSPFARPVYAVIERLALVALAVTVSVTGYVACFNRLGALAATKKLSPIGLLFLSGLMPILPLAVPFLTLSLPVLSPLAALSPLMAFLELFPGSDATIHAFPYVAFGPFPPFALCVAAPIALGIALLALASCPTRAKVATDASPRRPPPVTDPARVILHPGRTAALMSWVQARTDNPLFTYEIRTRTRDGRWFNTLVVAGALFVIALGVAVQYPDVVRMFSFFSLLSFFQNSPFGVTFASLPQTCADLAALLLSVELYVLALRGQMVGEMLFVKDQERGALGPLLLTPLTAGQIFWGKVWGQAAGYVAAWAVCGGGSLLLYGLASPQTGPGLALSAWLLSLLFIAATFVLGLGLGAAVATHTLRYKMLRGLSTLLLILAYGGGFRLIVWPDLFTFVPNPQALLARHLVLGSLYALLLAAIAFLYARWRVAALRRRDMAFGEGAAG